MSHNVTLDGVKVTDLDLLNAAIKNLGIQGVSLDKVATTFRTYRGQATDCHARINLPGAHDIGLRRQGDGSFQMVFDPYDMSDVLKHPNCDGYDASSRVSRLLQEYGLVQAEYEAGLRGMRTQRVAGEKGHVALECFA